MFARSAAPDTLQGRAIQAVNEKWGDVMPRFKRGRESIGMAVCKKKYAPFRFYLEKQQPDRPSSDSIVAGVGGPTAIQTVRVERMFGCPCHHNLRRSVIRQYGERPGWEPFGQWSLRKAEDIARRETARLRSKPRSSSDDETFTDSEDSSSNSLISGSSASSANLMCEFVADNKSRTTTLCANGNCLWRVRSAYDDVQQELLDQQQQEDHNRELQRLGSSSSFDEDDPR
ncbi:hypothetical protein ACA910_004288 [Epithemia clementina (nom. ined.)]